MRVFWPSHGGGVSGVGDHHITSHYYNNNYFHDIYIHVIGYFVDVIVVITMTFVFIINFFLYPKKNYP